MNCPPVLSYRSEVPPVLRISTASVRASPEQVIFWVLKLVIADVLVSSLPAKISNFSGTVLPPLTVFIRRPCRPARRTR